MCKIKTEGCSFFAKLIFPSSLARHMQAHKAIQTQYHKLRCSASKWIIIASSSEEAAFTPFQLWRRYLITTEKTQGQEWRNGLAGLTAPSECWCFSWKGGGETDEASATIPPCWCLYSLSPATTPKRAKEKSSSVKRWGKKKKERKNKLQMRQPPTTPAPPTTAGREQAQASPPSHLPGTHRCEMRSSRRDNQVTAVKYVITQYQCPASVAFTLFPPSKPPMG